MTTSNHSALDGLPGSLRGLRALFRSLPAAGAPPVPGAYRVTFVGPAALRIAAPRVIALGGMPNWYGKRFDPDGTAVNLLGEGAALREVLPMCVAAEASWLDGRPATVVSYGADGPVPWRWVRDEFRPLDASTLLGLTFAVAPASRVLASPFVLVRQD
ncbi:hypothetical protein OED52_03760 [Rhodococcus sp. Z13]|uniref:Uncharacterized protein n=1 Tax=Rhodococcus sacchari TaxID=2962047 RepID=A0ACD4DHZ7_9NOCA|nr:hypothetical protein [Rhodococcus sp. Z13]UYP19689.1 hypothetical protein OED52_03760 [Rhodococcus sp. Z13]